MKLANIKKELLNANLKHDEKKRVKFRKKMFEKIIEYKNRGKKFFAKHILQETKMTASEYWRWMKNNFQ